MTLSLLFTERKNSQEEKINKPIKILLTVKATYYWLLMRALSDDKFDMRIFVGNVLDVVEKKSACVSGRWPFVTVFEYKFSDLGKESGMAVCRSRAKFCANNGRNWRQAH